MRGPSNAWHIAGAHLPLLGVTNALVVVSLSPDSPDKNYRRGAWYMARFRYTFLEGSNSLGSTQPYGAQGGLRMS